MTTPQGRPEQPPSGPVDPNHPTQAFASPGQVPPGQPSQGFPGGGPAQGRPPQDVSTQGPPPQGPPQGPPYQGPPGQDAATRSRPQQDAPPHGRPFEGPPPQGPPPQGLPQGVPSQGLPPRGAVGGDGWGPSSGFGPAHPSASGQFGPNQVGAPRPKSANAIWTLGLVSLVAVVCGLSISEDGKNAWETVHAWGALAIVGSLLTLATVVAAGSLGTTRAWQVAACGAGALVLFWVLFVLPSVGSNTSLVTTIGVATGAVAVWIAPGRADTTRPGGDRTSEHTW